jgi:hypothetical protein
MAVHTFLGLPALLLIIFRKGGLFNFKAAETLLKEIPYDSVRLEVMSFLLRQRYLQNMIREVYLKYGYSE